MLACREDRRLGSERRAAPFVYPAALPLEERAVPWRSQAVLLRLLEAAK
jgi:hypothetical protein